MARSSKTLIIPYSEYEYWGVLVCPPLPHTIRWEVTETAHIVQGLIEVADAGPRDTFSLKRPRMLSNSYSPDVELRAGHHVDNLQDDFSRRSALSCTMRSDCPVAFAVFAVNLSAGFSVRKLCKPVERRSSPLPVSGCNYRKITFSRAVCDARSAGETVRLGELRSRPSIAPCGNHDTVGQTCRG